MKKIIFEFLVDDNIGYVKVGKNRLEIATFLGVGCEEKLSILFGESETVLSIKEVK